MSFSKQRPGYIRRVCPNKSYLPKIDANEVDQPGQAPRPRPRPRALPPSRLLHLQRKRHSRSSIPLQSHSAQKTRSCAWHLYPTRRRRAGAPNRRRRRSRCRRRTTARCTAGNVICRCTRTRCRRGCIYFCMRYGTRLVSVFLRRRCPSGLRRAGNGNVLLEGVSIAWEASSVYLSAYRSKLYHWHDSERLIGITLRASASIVPPTSLTISDSESAPHVERGSSTHYSSIHLNRDRL
jgi:hypothetical protein